MPPRICNVEPFRYQATPQPVGEQGASASQVNEQQIEDYLNRLRTALCEDIEEIVSAESFLALSDTPDSYAGAAGQAALVNGTETGLVFGEVLDEDGLMLDMSTTEQQTNRTYIDGKPIFQKTIQRAGNLGVGGTNIAHGITGLDRVVFMLGDVLRSNGGRFMVPFVDPATQFLVGLQYVDGTNLSIKLGAGWTGVGNVLSDLNLTIWYTKT
jgi:hypothetical protein